MRSIGQLVNQMCIQAKQMHNHSLPYLVFAHTLTQCLHNALTHSLIQLYRLFVNHFCMLANMKTLQTYVYTRLRAQIYIIYLYFYALVTCCIGHNGFADLIELEIGRNIKNNIILFQITNQIHFDMSVSTPKHYQLSL